MLADRDACRAGELEGSCAYGGVVGDGDGNADGRIGFTAGFDRGCATTDAIGDDGGCGGTGAAQYNSTGADLHVPADVIGSGTEENRAAEIVGLKRKRRDVVDRILEEDRIVLAGGPDGGNHGLDHRQRLASLVARDGVVDGDGALRCLRKCG